MRRAELSGWLKIALVAVLVLVALKYGLLPLYRWQDETMTRIRSLQKSLAKKEALVGNEENLRRALEKATTAFAATDALFYQDFADSRALQLRLQKKIEQLSAAGGVKITSSDWLYPTDGCPVRAPVRIKCTGLPEQVFSFLGAVESAGRFFTIDRLDVTSFSRSVRLAVDMDVSAYGLGKKEGRNE